MNKPSVIYTPECIKAWNEAQDGHFCNQPHKVILFVPGDVESALIYDQYDNYGLICSVDDLDMRLDKNTRPGIYEAVIEYWCEHLFDGEYDGGVTVHSILPMSASDSIYKQLAREAEDKVNKVYRDNEWSGIEAFHYKQLCEKYGHQDNASCHQMEPVSYFLGAVGRLVCYQENPSPTNSFNAFVSGIELIPELADYHDLTDEQLKQISIDFIQQGQYDKAGLALALLSDKQGLYKGEAA